MMSEELRVVNSMRCPKLLFQSRLRDIYPLSGSAGISGMMMLLARLIKVINYASW
jgi:hypothetical protein